MLCGSGRARVPGRLSSLARRTPGAIGANDLAVASSLGGRGTASGPHRRRPGNITRGQHTAHM